MKDNAIVFLACSRKESRYVYQRHDRDIESIAETNETCAFARCVAVEYTGKEFRLIGYNTYRLTVETGKTDNDILGIVFLDFQEFTVVHDSADNLVHIIRFVGAVGDNIVQRIFQTVDRICAIHVWSFFEVVLRNIAQKCADQCQTFFFCFGSEMSNTRFGRVNACSAEVFLAYVFTGYSFHYFRTCKEHIRSTFHHQCEVCQCRRINSTAGTRTEDTGNLRNDTRSEDIALEDFCVTCQSVNTFLDTCTARGIDTDTRSTHLHCLIHNLTDLQ